MKLIHIDPHMLNIDFDAILHEYNIASKHFEPFRIDMEEWQRQGSPGGATQFFNSPKNWKTHPLTEESTYSWALKQLIESKSGLTIKGRYYWLDANTTIPEHTDRVDSTTALNILLNDNNAPITMDGEPILYSVALIDISSKHGVPAHYKERKLLKFVFKERIDEVAEKLGLIG